jgi:hypothetical protein
MEGDAARTVSPRFLDGTSPPEGEPPREWLARKILEYGDGQFAKAAVNRIWRHFMGLGFVEPVDRFSSSSPPIQAALFASLAADFRLGGWSVPLSRGILLSRPTNRLGPRRAPESEKYSFKILKPQDPPQVLNSLVWTLNPRHLKTFMSNSRRTRTPGLQSPEVFRQYLFRFVRICSCGRRAPEGIRGGASGTLKLMNGKDPRFGESGMGTARRSPEGGENSQARGRAPISRSSRVRPTTRSKRALELVESAGMPPHSAPCSGSCRTQKSFSSITELVKGPKAPRLQGFKDASQLDLGL